MLIPRGPLPQKVYWRRRMFLAAFAVLAIVTVIVVAVGGGDSSDDSGPLGGVGPSQTQSSTPVITPSTRSAATSAPASSAAPSASTSAAAASTGPAQPCPAGALRLGAATDAPSYAVNASPALRIVITNASATACTADLSDQQIELFVYFGEARIWGSHDCNIEPGSAVQTLIAGQAVTREIIWTGLSSVPGCTATRQRAPAGTYTLRPALSGVAGTPSTFAFV